MENENNNTTTQGTENNGEQGTNDLEARLVERCTKFGVSYLYYIL